MEHCGSEGEEAPASFLHTIISLPQLLQPARLRFPEQLLESGLPASWDICVGAWSPWLLAGCACFGVAQHLTPTPSPLPALPFLGVQGSPRPGFHLSTLPAPPHQTSTGIRRSLEQEIIHYSFKTSFFDIFVSVLARAQGPGGGEQAACRPGLSSCYDLASSYQTGPLTNPLSALGSPK